LASLYIIDCSFNRFTGRLMLRAFHPTERESTMNKTISVSQAGRDYFDMSRNASYAAVRRGDLPIVRVGKLLRLLVRALEAMLDGAIKTTTVARV
jgi:hypothetical protein